jgi:protein-tyrosine kinase
MSRIDEALRRASSGAGNTAAVTRNPSHEAPIDTYPSEGSSLITDPARVIIDPAREPSDRRSGEPRRFQFLRALKEQPERVRLDSDAKLVTSHTSFVGVEQYRRLAASLHDAQLATGLRVVTITSASPRDGKTLTSVNLALTLSESYSLRVLLIDADLRRPSVHSTLGIRNRSGLSEILHGDLRELPLVVVSANLSVLTAGRSHATPLAGLASDRMRQLLDDCASRFDWVLLDVPPAGLLADAQILGHLTGAVILVIRAGVTPHAVVERAIAQIGRESIVGTVLNATEASAAGASKHYGNYDRDDV